MRRLNRRGFTIIEMVVVMGIIIILAGVMYFGVQKYLKHAHAIATQISSKQVSLSQANSALNEQIDLGY